MAALDDILRGGQPPSLEELMRLRDVDGLGDDVPGAFQGSVDEFRDAFGVRTRRGVQPPATRAAGVEPRSPSSAPSPMSWPGAGAMISI